MSLRANILSRVCSHRRHLRLENLRTLMLADNCMNRIQLSTDDDGFSAASNDSADELDDWVFIIINIRLFHLHVKPCMYISIGYRRYSFGTFKIKINIS